jgi:hypothetical protein
MYTPFAGAVDMLIHNSFTYTGVQHYFHIISRLTVTRRVSHVKQELLSIPDHMTSCLVFSWVRSLVSEQCFVDHVSLLSFQINIYQLLFQSCMSVSITQKLFTNEKKGVDVD